VLIALALFLIPYNWTSPSLSETKTNILIEAPVEPVMAYEVPLSLRVKQYLEGKGSPLAPETEYLMEQEHWRLLIAISAIESQFCKRKISYNCWGIGGDSAYKHYGSYREAIKSANDLIEHWQNKGKWLTVESMNCSYVVPCSDNWVRVTNKTLREIPK
jgi:hypothetical protein